MSLANISGLDFGFISKVFSISGKFLKDTNSLKFVRLVQDPSTLFLVLQEVKFTNRIKTFFLLLPLKVLKIVKVDSENVSIYVPKSKKQTLEFIRGTSNVIPVGLEDLVNVCVDEIALDPIYKAIRPNVFDVIGYPVRKEYARVQYDFLKIFFDNLVLSNMGKDIRFTIEGRKETFVKRIAGGSLYSNTYILNCDTCDFETLDYKSKVTSFEKYSFDYKTDTYGCKWL